MTKCWPTVFASSYSPAFLHAKVAVVDGIWATVGSSNIDPLSLLLNLEANVLVQDVEFSTTLRSRIEQAQAVSRGSDRTAAAAGLARPVVASLRGLVRQPLFALGWRHQRY